MGVEGAVPEGDDADAVDFRQPVGDALCLLVVADLDRDLADRAVAADRDRVDVADEACFLGDAARIPSRAVRPRGAARSGRRSRRPWPIRRLDPGAGWRVAAPLPSRLPGRLFPLFPLNAPNILTVSRILMVPVIVVALLDETAEGDVIAAALFAVAALTDGLDGYIARRQRQETTFGKLMDPLADKLLVTAALVSLVSLDRRRGLGGDGDHRARVRGHRASLRRGRAWSRDLRELARQGEDGPPGGGDLRPDRVRADARRRGHPGLRRGGDDRHLGR